MTKQKFVVKILPLPFAKYYLLMTKLSIGDFTALYVL
jgi:hypothetical protein